MLGILIIQKNIQEELKKPTKKMAEKCDYDGIELRTAVHAICACTFYFRYAVQI